MAAQTSLKILREGLYANSYRDDERVIKIFNPGNEQVGQYEAKIYDIAKIANLEVPDLLRVHMTKENQFAIDLEFFKGKPILDTKSKTENFEKTIKKMVQLQMQVHETKAFGISKTNDILAFQIQNHKMFGGVAIKNRLLKQLDFIGNMEIQLLHGYFYPDNIYKYDKRYFIIDWTNASAGSPLTDVAKTYLLMKLHYRKYAEMYLREYTSAALIDKKLVLDWVPIMAASMLVDGNLDTKSQKYLLEVIDKFMLSTKKKKK